MKKSKDNKKKKKSGNHSSTDLPDLKSNTQTSINGKSMKTTNGD